MHHFSPGPFAQQLGLIEKTTHVHGSLLIGNDEGEYYRLARFVAEKHAQIYQTLHATGVLLNSLPIPRNNIEWAQVQTDAEVLADKLKIERPPYRWPWLLRSYIFAEMRHAGVNKLKIVEDWNAEQLQVAIRPDQNEWLSTWMHALAGDSLKALLRRMQFTESLEMLSIYSCILNDSSIMTYPLKQMKKRVGDITTARQQMRKPDGQEANPALVLRAVMDSV